MGDPERERITNFIIACRLIVRNPSPLIDNTPTSHNDSLPRSAGFASLSRADDLQECFDRLENITERRMCTWYSVLQPKYKIKP
jgi:hypothetical protein